MSDQPHVLPLRVYFGVFGLLLGLTALTTWVAYQDLGELATLVALTIACVKTLAVVLYFMHLRYSEHLLWIFAGASLLWLLILFTFLLGDYATRPPLPGWGG